MSFSKKFESRCHAVVLVLLLHNFSVHKTLDIERAMAAGVINLILRTEDCISVIEARRALKPRGPCGERELVEIFN